MTANELLLSAAAVGGVITSLYLGLRKTGIDDRMNTTSEFKAIIDGQKSFIEEQRSMYQDLERKFNKCEERGDRLEKKVYHQQEQISTLQKENEQIRDKLNKSGTK